jgi:galactokinase
MSPAAPYAPGRVELLGNHTDYNQGVILAAAVDRGLTVKGTLRERTN